MAASSTACANPKSSSFGDPSAVNPMLLGLTSPCRYPFSCRAARASASRGDDRDRLRGGERPVPQPILQRAAGQELDDQERAAPPGLDAVDLGHGRMRHRRHGPGFRLQPHEADEGALGQGRADSRAAVARLAPVPGGRAVRLSGHLRRKLGADAGGSRAACSACSKRRRPFSSRSPRHRRLSHNCRRRRGACGSMRWRTGRGTWCSPRGRSTRIGRGPCKGSLPCRFRASEGVV